MDDLSEFKQIPILDVADRLQLNRKGKKAFCFTGHDKKTMSLSFVPSKNIWKCFGCGKKGDVLQLVMEVCSCSFKEALSWFTDEFKVMSKSAVSKQTRKKIRPMPSINPVHQIEKTVDQEALTWFISRCSLVEGVSGRTYLEEHGISPDTANQFGVRELKDASRAAGCVANKLGVARAIASGLVSMHRGSVVLHWKSNSLLFPFWNGKEVAYIQGRQLCGGAKFKGLADIKPPLYNLVTIQEAKPGATIYLCEGIPDALAMESIGRHAVAVLGSCGFNPEWANLFKMYDLVIIPDGDNGGRVFAATVEANIIKVGGQVRVLSVPDDMDAADVIQNLLSKRKIL